MIGGGGGFLDQMNRTLKANREMLRNALRKRDHKVFNRENVLSAKSKPGFVEKKKYTESHRKDLLFKLTLEKRKGFIKTIIAFLISILMLVTLYYYFSYQFHYYR